MAYKISDKAILIESAGENMLIAETATFERGGLTILDTDFTLSPTFVTDYFAASYTFQGSTSGYRSGGHISSSNASNVIDNYPFASDTNASDVGDLTVGRNDCAGASSNTHGYVAAGQRDTNGPTQYNTIDKFPFSADENATDVGDITETRRSSSGHSMETHGYASGGRRNSPTLHNGDIIEKYSFSSDGNSSDVGDLTEGRDRTAGHSSTTHGYTSGGGTAPPFTPVVTIDKFSFSSDGNATDVGDLPVGQEGPGGTSSTASGYAAGGWGPGSMNNIQKFPFSSDDNGSDVGDLTQARNNSQSASSSTTHGYTNGGNPSGNIIDKYSFSSDGNATDVGDLSTNYSWGATGQQV